MCIYLWCPGNLFMEEWVIISNDITGKNSLIYHYILNDNQGLCRIWQQFPTINLTSNCEHWLLIPNIKFCINIIEATSPNSKYKIGLGFAIGTAWLSFPSLLKLAQGQSAPCQSTIDSWSEGCLANVSGRGSIPSSSWRGVLGTLLHMYKCTCAQHVRDKK